MSTIEDFKEFFEVDALDLEQQKEVKGGSADPTPWDDPDDDGPERPWWWPGEGGW
ncbi:MAG: hypothetical protein KTR30_34125 [Saprospiraceae bacterium]|nr:hypothetical protein [Saprospiraceae bacterium]